MEAWYADLFPTGSNCESWLGGSADFSAKSGDWIYAAASGGSDLNSDDVKLRINQHSSQGTFQWDYTNAKGGSSDNPFFNQSDPPPISPGTPSHNASGISAATGDASSSSSSSPSSGESPPPGGEPTSYGPSPGVIVGIVFGALFVVILLGGAIWLYISRKRKLRRRGQLPNMPELAQNEKSRLKRFRGGRWRAEIDATSRLVEIDGRSVNVMPGPPRELQANPVPHR